MWVLFNNSINKLLLFQIIFLLLFWFSWCKVYSIHYYSFLCLSCLFVHPFVVIIISASIQVYHFAFFFPVLCPLFSQSLDLHRSSLVVSLSMWFPLRFPCTSFRQIEFFSWEEEKERKEMIPVSIHSSFWSRDHFLFGFFSLFSFFLSILFQVFLPEFISILTN